MKRPFQNVGKLPKPDNLCFWEIVGKCTGARIK
jgi:hypothetical protein